MCWSYQLNHNNGELQIFHDDKHYSRINAMNDKCKTPNNHFTDICKKRISAYVSDLLAGLLTDENSRILLSKQDELNSLLQMASQIFCELTAE